MDDTYGRRLAEELRGKVRVITYALDTPANYTAADIREELSGSSFTINGRPCHIRLLGRHNVYNALAAYAVCVHEGVSPDAAAEGLAALPGVPGRMERVDAGQDFYAFVDFAYTDESLRRAYEAVERFRKGRVITVFGCGGERDRTKRPLMGRTASTHSDLVFLTNDNPRREDPRQIFNDILAGMEGCSNYTVEPDRAAAIAKALDAARAGDIVIIAGKGHEDYQIIGTEKRGFSDRETVLSRLKEIKRVQQK